MVSEEQEGSPRFYWRRAGKATQALGSLNLEKHPDKTFIGRIERGFDFLGYHFGPAGLSVAVKSVEQFVARATRLYEQEPGEAFASSRLGLYVKRWLRWTRGGVQVCCQSGAEACETILSWANSASNHLG